MSGIGARKGLDLRIGRRRPEPYAYDGPFRCRIVLGSTFDSVSVDQGYVYAGAWAEYSFPAVGDTASVSLTGLADGTYLILMEVTVDDDMGFFTSAYKPVLAQCAEASYTALQSNGQCDIILARIKVVSQHVMTLRQDQRSHIYVPVRCWHFTSPETCSYYFCSLETRSHRLYYDTVDITFESGLCTSHPNSTATVVDDLDFDTDENTDDNTYTDPRDAPSFSGGTQVN